MMAEILEVLPTQNALRKQRNDTQNSLSYLH